MTYLDKPDNFNPKFNTAAVYVVVNGKILFQKRGSHKNYPGVYDVPGGKIEEDETPIEAAKRELFEESGINVNLEDLVQTTIFYVTFEEFDFGYYTYRLNLDDYPEIILSKEHSEYKWVKISDALKLDLIPDEDKCLTNLFEL